MGKDIVSDLETTFREAFEYAQAARKAAGLAPAKPTLTVVKKGPNKSIRLGASKYKMTLWLFADEYVDLLRYRESLGFTGGPTTLIRKMIREALPAKQRAQALKPRAGLNLANEAPTPRQPSRIQQFKQRGAAA